MKINEFQILFDQLQPRVDRNRLESPLEELFIENLEKYISPNAEIIPQFEVETITGVFRLDFVLLINDRKIGIECDGLGFHDEWKDEWRDAIILGSKQIDTIYRFRGKDLHTFLSDCIFLIYCFDKDLFCDRYPLIAPQLISDDLKQQINYIKSNYSERKLIGYSITNSDGEHIGRMLLVMGRRNKNHKFEHWNTLYEIALGNPGLNIQQLIEISKNILR
jgi:hypothetical protein